MTVRGGDFFLLRLEVDSARTAEAKYQWIRFIKNQFGVQTMRNWGGGRFFGSIVLRKAKKV